LIDCRIESFLLNDVIQKQ